MRAGGLASAAAAADSLLLEVFLSSAATRLTGMTTDDDGDLAPVLDLAAESDDVVDDVGDDVSSPASSRSLAICAQHEQIAETVELH